MKHEEYLKHEECMNENMCEPWNNAGKVCEPWNCKNSMHEKLMKCVNISDKSVKSMKLMKTKKSIHVLREIHEPWKNDAS